MSAHDQIKAELDAKEPAAAVMLSREVAVEVCREHNLLRAAVRGMREALEIAAPHFFAHMQQRRSDEDRKPAEDRWGLTVVEENQIKVVRAAIQKAEGSAL